ARRARRSRVGAHPEVGLQPARRHPAPVHGAGHHQGPPYRDRADERPDRTQGRRDRRARAEPCQAHRAGDEDRAGRARAFAKAFGRLKPDRGSRTRTIGRAAMDDNRRNILKGMTAMAAASVSGIATAKSKAYDPAARYELKVSEVPFRKNAQGRQLIARIYQP